MSKPNLKQGSMAYSITTIITSPNGDLTAEIIISANDDKGNLSELNRTKILWSEYFSTLEEKMVEVDPHHLPLCEQFNPQELTSMWFEAVKAIRAETAGFLDKCLEENVVSVAQIPGQSRPSDSDLAILSSMLKIDPHDN
jgi:hypothetical protein